MADDETSTAIVRVVAEFSRDLADVKHAGEEGRAQLKADVEALMTAVRHDVYGSVIYLNQGLAELRTMVEGERRESQEWRVTDRLDRAHGRMISRLVHISIAALAFIGIIIAVLALLKAAGAF